MEQLQSIKLTFKCPKQLNDLQPFNGDWYCDGCQKIVHDFRGMSEVQILAVISTTQRPCGIFEAGRIKVVPQQTQWFRWASAAMLAVGLTSCYNAVIGQVKKVIDTRSSKDTTQFIGTISSLPPQELKEKTLVHLLPDSVVFGGVSEINPEFPGGEAAFKKFVYSHLKYDGDYQGRAYVQFYVETDGWLTDIKILRGTTKELDKQIIDILKQSPKWKPGMQNGKPHRVQYTVPVWVFFEQ